MPKPSIGKTRLTLYVALCDECGSASYFTTERERDLWQMFHPHQEDPA